MDFSVDVSVGGSAPPDALQRPSERLSPRRNLRHVVSRESAEKDGTDRAGEGDMVSEGETRPALSSRTGRRRVRMR